MQSVVPQLSPSEIQERLKWLLFVMIQNLQSQQNKELQQILAPFGSLHDFFFFHKVNLRILLCADPGSSQQPKNVMNVCDQVNRILYQNEHNLDISSLEEGKGIKQATKKKSLSNQPINPISFGDQSYLNTMTPQKPNQKQNSFICLSEDSQEKYNKPKKGFTAESSQDTNLPQKFQAMNEKILEKNQMKQQIVTFMNSPDMGNMNITNNTVPVLPLLKTNTSITNKQKVSQKQTQKLLNQTLAQAEQWKDKEIDMALNDLELMLELEENDQQNNTQNSQGRQISNSNFFEMNSDQTSIADPINIQAKVKALVDGLIDVVKEEDNRKFQKKNEEGIFSTINTIKDFSQFDKVCQLQSKFYMAKNFANFIGANNKFQGRFDAKAFEKLMYPANQEELKTQFHNILIKDNKKLAPMKYMIYQGVYMYLFPLFLSKKFGMQLQERVVKHQKNNPAKSLSKKSMKLTVSESIKKNENYYWLDSFVFLINKLKYQQYLEHDSRERAIYKANFEQLLSLMLMIESPSFQLQVCEAMPQQ